MSSRGNNKLEFVVAMIDKITAPLSKVLKLMDRLKAVTVAGPLSKVHAFTVNLVDKVSGPLNRMLNRNEAAMKRFQSGFGRLKNGAMDIAYPVKDFMTGVLDTNKEYQTITEKFNQYGMGDAALKEAEKFASAANIMGASRNDILKYFTEAQGVFRESGAKTLEEQLAAAKMAAPTLAKINMASKGLDEHMQGLLHDQQMDMLRFTEQMGGLKSPERFNELMSSGFKAIQSSGGNVNWEQYRQFVSKAGSSAFGLSDQALFAKLEPIIGEMKGGAAGDALMTSYQRLNGIVKNKAMAHKLIDYGIWNKKAVVFDALGGVKKFVPGRKVLKTEAADLLASDPVAFYEKIILPKYKQRGLSEREILTENSLIFGRQGGKMFNLIHKQQEPIHRSVEAFDKARGIDGAYNAIQKTYAGQQMNLDAKWKDFQLALGQDGGLLDLATRGLQHLADAVSWLTAAAKSHPILAKFAMVAGGVVVGLAAFAMVASVVSMAVGALEVLGVVVGVVLSPIGLLIAGAAALAYGIYELYGYLKEVSWSKIMSGVFDLVVTAAFGPFLIALDAIKGVWEWLKPSLANTEWGKSLIDIVDSVIGAFDRLTNAFKGVKENLVKDYEAGGLIGIAESLGNKMFGPANAAPTANTVNNGGARALGGPVMPGNFYRVNERGPELLQTQGQTYLMTGGHAGKIIPFPGMASSPAPAMTSSSFTNPLPSLASKTPDLGQSVMAGLLQGLKDQSITVIDWLSDFSNDLIDKVKSALGIRSPSKVFAEIGEWTLEGMQKGMASRRNRLLDFLSNLGDRFKQWGSEIAASFSTNLFGSADISTPAPTSLPLSTNNVPVNNAAGAAALPPALAAAAKMAPSSSGDGGGKAKGALDAALHFSANKSLTGMSDAQTRAYAGNTMMTESGGKINSVNSYGFSGQYQFGAEALAEAGLVDMSKLKAARAAAGKSWYKGGYHKAFLANSANWTLAGGQSAFLSNKALQDAAFVDYTNRNIQGGIRSGAIRANDDPAKIAAYAKAAHLKGVGGANQLFLKGQSSQDAYGTSTAAYAQQARTAITDLAPQVQQQMSNGGARALGGHVMPDSFYRVNERGPELLQTLGQTFLMTGGHAGNIIPFPSLADQQNQKRESSTTSLLSRELKQLNVRDLFGKLSSKSAAVTGNGRQKTIHIGTVNIHTNNKIDPYELEKQLGMLG